MAGDTPHLDFGLSDSSQGILEIGLQGRRCCFCKQPLKPPRRKWCSDACCWLAWDQAHPRLKDGQHVVQKALPGESRVERAFREWVASEDGQRVESEVVHRARRLMAQGQLRYGIAALIESIRYDHAVRLIGPSDGYRINNNVRSLLARRVMERHADLAGFFEVRELRGRA